MAIEKNIPTGSTKKLLHASKRRKSVWANFTLIWTKANNPNNDIKKFDHVILSFE